MEGMKMSRERVGNHPFQVGYSRDSTLEAIKIEMYSKKLPATDPEAQAQVLFASLVRSY